MKKIVAAGLVSVMGLSVIGCGFVKDSEAYMPPTKSVVLPQLSVSSEKEIKEQLKSIEFVEKNTYPGIIRFKDFRTNQGIEPYLITDFNSKTTVYGFIDQETGAFIKPVYEEVKMVQIGHFNEGLEPVKKNGLYGYINKEGKTVIDFSYEDAGVFDQGIAPVKKNGVYGFINTKGEIIIQPQYKEAGNFNGDLAHVTLKDGSYALINKAGKVLIQSKEGIEPLLDYSGEEVPIYFALPKGERRALVKILDGQIVFKTDYKYGDLRLLENGVEYMTLDEQGYQQSGQINDKGEEIPFNIDDQQNYENSGLKNSAGQYVVVGEYGMSTIMKKDGQPLTAKKYLEVAISHDGQYWRVSDDEMRVSIIDQEGKEVLKPIEGTIDFVEGISGYCMVEIYNMNNQDQEPVKQLYNLKSQKYIAKNLRDVYVLEDKFVFNQDDKSGLMSLDGKVLVEPYDGYQYKEHQKGYWIKSDNNAAYIADLKGNRLSDESFMFIGGIDQNGYRQTMNNYKYGLASADGKTLIPTMAEKVVVIDKETALVVISLQNETIIGRVKIPQK